jgi:hypothetical protein
MSTDNNLWMGDVQTWMDESFILKSFNFYKFFPKSIKLIHDKITKELKNFCFINFQTMKEANNCLLSLNGKLIPQTNIKFKLNWANYFSTFNKSVYVGNLSPDVDDIQLYQLFKEKYPSVHHASVIAENGVSKGFGFILFRGEEDYKKCLNEMNGTLFHGNIIKVNEQKKNKHKNSFSNNFSCDNNDDNDNDNEELSNNNDNLNMDMAYNGINKTNYINNNNMEYSFQNNNFIDSPELNSNSIIDFYNLNNINNNNFINGFQNMNNLPFQIHNNRNNISIFNVNGQQKENTYMNQFQLNNDNQNSNKSNIINNIIHINNINKIQNINYINEINKINNKNQILNQKNNQINNNYLKQNLNNNKNQNNNKLELLNRQQLQNLNTSNNKSFNDINLNKNLFKNEIIGNINSISEPKINVKQKSNKNMNKANIINKQNTKIINETITNKENNEKNDLEILKNYDEKTLYKKISKNLDMMYRYYIEQYPYALNKLFLSNMFIYYCQNEKQLKFYNSIF